MRTTIVTILCMIIALFSLTNQGAEAVKLSLLREEQPGFLQTELGTAGKNDACRSSQSCATSGALCQNGKCNK